MKHIRIALILFTVAGVVVLHCEFAQADGERRTVEFNTALMLSTFRLHRPSSQGTAFLVGRPHPKAPTKLRYVLVTAAHVLDEMRGDLAFLILRREVAPTKWENLPLAINIRDGGRNLWTKHPEADVAVMYIGAPKDARGLVMPMDMLADDDLLAKHEIHPGDELNCLGYPFGIGSSQGDFPVLRSGKIASYPLLPTKKTKTFMLDFPVFPGNSGGPVYIFYNGARISGESIVMNTFFQFVVGLVSQERRVTQKVEELYGKREQSYPLGLAEIVHASLIRETIDLLPLPEDITD